MKKQGECVVGITDLKNKINLNLDLRMSTECRHTALEMGGCPLSS